MSAWRRRLIGAVGLAATLVGAWLGGVGAILAALGGAALALSAGRWVLHSVRKTPGTHPLDFPHTLELLQRAHQALAGWAVGLREGDVSVERIPESGLEHATRERGAALVRLASVDGRAHVAREAVGTFIAVGDFPYGAGLLLPQSDVAPEIAELVVEELRRLVATMRLVELELPDVHGQLVAKQLALIASGAQTLQGIAKAGAELAQQLSQRGAAVAVRGGPSLGVAVVAVSSVADRHLEGQVLDEQSVVCRAIGAAVPIVAQPDDDVFGPGAPERRRGERAGTAYPLMDGHVVVGALVLIGTPVPPDGPLAEQIGRLVMELGPRVAAARSVEEAERRAMSDPLTGLKNRREFERVLDRFAGGGAAALIYADLDHFKRLNDTLGHAAGDAALRHIKGILEEQVRGRDLVARIGGEEFAVWLPGTPLRGGLEVAERIRYAVAHTEWRWNGTPYPLSTSCGVAAYPECTGEIKNLPSLADGALYRAKQRGRDCVEAATGVPFTE